MQNKNETISRHCGHGPRVQGRYKEKTTLLNRLDPGYPADRPSGMTTKRAFTLIELLVVVLIIGILAAVAVPQYQKAVEKARLTEALVLGKHIRDLEETYYLANGEYTNSFVDLGMDIPAGYSFKPEVRVYELYSDKYSIYLDTGATPRVIYYYGTPGNPHLALFFWYQNSNWKGKITCYPYTDHGIELCKVLNL